MHPKYCSCIPNSLLCFKLWDASTLQRIFNLAHCLYTLIFRKYSLLWERYTQISSYFTGCPKSIGGPILLCLFQEKMGPNSQFQCLEVPEKELPPVTTIGSLFSSVGRDVAEVVLTIHWIFCWGLGLWLSMTEAVFKKERHLIFFIKEMPFQWLQFKCWCNFVISFDRALIQPSASGPSE